MKLILKLCIGRQNKDDMDSSLPENIELNYTLD